MIAIVAISIAAYLFVGAVIAGIWTGRAKQTVDGGSIVLMTVAWWLLLTTMAVAALTHAISAERGRHTD